MKYALPVVAALAVALAITLGFQSTQAADDKAHGEGLPEAPAFTLTDTHGNEHELADFRGKYVVLEWINDGCPFVQKFYNAGKMQQWQEHYTGKGVVWLAIASSKPGAQGHHSPDGWNKIIDNWNINATALLLDPSGTVGRAYDAKTTPHMFVINPDGKLIYNGAIDSIRSTKADDIAKADNYVTQLLDAVLVKTTTPYGCSVKY
jgi:peroxiredoxin